jgi:hypothetical protein
MPKERQSTGTTRREIMKRSLYVAPAIMTFAVSPSFAQAASGDSGSKGKGK